MKTSPAVGGEGRGGGGLRFYLPGNSTKTVVYGDKFRLTTGTNVRLSDGRLIMLPAGTQVILVG